MFKRIVKNYLAWGRIPSIQKPGNISEYYIVVYLTICSIWFIIGVVFGIINILK